MASSNKDITNKTTLDQFMNSLAREYASLEPDEPRRTEIAQQLSKLSLLAKQFTNTIQ